MPHYQTKSVLYRADTFDERFRVKAVDDSKGIIEAYASKFGNEDSYKDIVVPGAYKRTLNSQLAKKSKQTWLWPYLFQHDEKSILGGIQDAEEDDFGLLYQGQCNMETQLGREQYSNAKMGVLFQSSIGYDVPKGGAEYKDGIRYLKEIRLWEISLVTFAANPEATVVDVKNNKRTFVMPPKAQKDFNDNYRKEQIQDWMWMDMNNLTSALTDSIMDIFKIGDEPEPDLVNTILDDGNGQGFISALKEYVSNYLAELQSSQSSYSGMMSGSGADEHKAMNKTEKQNLSDHVANLHDKADQILADTKRHTKAMHTAADDLATVLQVSEPAYTTDPGTPEKATSPQARSSKDHSSSVDTDLSEALSGLVNLRAMNQITALKRTQ
jgi:HK97 family phage prohead protease